MKENNWTKEELDELTKSLIAYLCGKANFSLDCQGGQLLSIMMVLKKFTQLEGTPQILARELSSIYEYFKQNFLTECSGAQLIDFENPDSYLYSLEILEPTSKNSVYVMDLSGITELIEQKMREQS